MQGWYSHKNQLKKLKSFTIHTPHLYLTCPLKYVYPPVHHTSLAAIPTSSQTYNLITNYKILTTTLINNTYCHFIHFWDFHSHIGFRMFADVGMAVREVWWIGGCLLQGTSRCGVWIVNNVCLLTLSACAEVVTVLVLCVCVFRVYTSLKAFIRLDWYID